MSENHSIKHVLAWIFSQTVHGFSRNEFEKIKKGVLSKSANVDIIHQIVMGDMVEEILTAKEEIKAQLIIMGTSGKSGGPKIDEEGNTNTQELVRNADCPVLVVPKSIDTFEINIITLALDKSTIEDPEVLSTLLVIARRHEAEIHVLTIFEEGDQSYLREHENENILKYYFENFYTHSSSIVSNSIAQSIVDYDHKNSIDLLAILPHNHAKNRPPSKGRLTQFLTKRTDIPLLIID